jgi:hypothetical protein
MDKIASKPIQRFKKGDAFVAIAPHLLIEVMLYARR